MNRSTRRLERITAICSPTVTKLVIVLGLLPVFLMATGIRSGAAMAFGDPVAAQKSASPAVSLPLPMSARIAAEKMTRMEQTWSMPAQNLATIPSECATLGQPQQIAALSTQTGLSHLLVSKALQADCSSLSR